MADVTGKKLVQILEHVAKKIEANKDFLCELDGIVGDGDHGVSMTIGMRGVARAVKKLPDDVLPEEVFRVAAEAYAEDVGATIGPLYETAFNAAARVSSKKNRLNSISDWLEIYDAMAESIKTLGQAELGDKTMIDSF
ncbi:MAG: DAK2 domain-containing protein, partial [Actinobacteria bacterium]|nr:DAK2 domain-containing protein [Actinomycetota bacterium]